MTEDRIQQEIVQWYTNNYCLKHHKPRGLVFHVPNEQQQKRVRIGVMAGVSDLIVILPTNKLIFVEIKTTSGKTTPKQDAFAERVDEHGFTYVVIRSLEGFKNLIKDQLYENC